MIDTTNRVLAHADKVRARIASGRKPDGSPLGDTAQLDKSLALTSAEWFAYQNAQARAHATGKLTTDEAAVVYLALGGETGGSPANGHWAVDTDLALKVTITNLIGELIGAGR